MDLSIIIVNWNTKPLLERCLQSVFETANDLEFETFVVDNASTDDSVVMVWERFPQVKLIENSDNVGFAYANNQAILLSKGRYVLLLNSDTEVKPGALTSLLAFMDVHPLVGAVGPHLLNSDGSLQPSCYPLLTPWREFWRLLFLDRLTRRATYDMENWDLHTPREVEVIKGACLLVRQEALEKIGLLDTRYFMYTEEMDLCYRLQRAGWKLYWVPDAQVLHYGEASSKQIAETMYVQLYRSKVQFHRKTGGEARASLFKVLLALAYAPRFIIATASRPIRPASATQARTFRRLLSELATM